MTGCRMFDSKQVIVYEYPRMLLGRNKPSLSFLDLKSNQSLIVTGGVGLCVT